MTGLFPNSFFFSTSFFLFLYGVPGQVASVSADDDFVFFFGFLFPFSVRSAGWVPIFFFGFFFVFLYGALG